jgi:hypothetical protein
MHRVVSTLVPSTTGGVIRSMTVTFVEGYLAAKANAVDKPKTPAPMIMTSSGTPAETAFWAVLRTDMMKICR